MSNNPVYPKDILPDGVDSAVLNGKLVRKGSIAAFLANITIAENANATASEKEQAINAMKELAPAVIAIGLPKYVIFKNSLAEKILAEAGHK
jgi:hypothetical protein